MNRLGRQPSTGTGRDWSRTPAAMFACAVLGLASISGLAWSWNRDLRQMGSESAPARSVAALAGASMPARPSEPHRPSRADAIKRIDVNAADLAELDLLPGVGPAIGQRIIDDRRANGPFATIDDLQRVSGIGPRTIEKIRPLAVVGDSAPSPLGSGG